MNRASSLVVISGSLLAVLGIAGLAVPVFFTQHTEDVAKIGDLKIQSKESSPHSIPPLVSAGALCLGIVLVVGGFARRR